MAHYISDVYWVRLVQDGYGYRPYTIGKEHKDCKYLLVYGSWQWGLDNSSPLVHLREKGVVATSKPFTCIEGKAGLVVVRCEYVLPTKSNVQQLSSASMVPRRQPADWLCIEVL